MGIVIDMIAEKSTVGHFNVEYPQVAEMTPTEEYDEDEQLYSGVNLEALQRKYKQEKVDVYRIGNSAEVWAVILPHLANTIAEKALATEVVKSASDQTAWIALAPSPLGNGASIRRLDLFTKQNLPLLTQIPPMNPPHFITGLVAAVVATAKRHNQFSDVAVLVLNAEGHSGFEKVDADSLMDAVHVIAEQLVGSNKPQYIRDVSKHVRKVNLAAVSGMYL